MLYAGLFSNFLPPVCLEGSKGNLPEPPKMPTIPGTTGSMRPPNLQGLSTGTSEGNSMVRGAQHYSSLPSFPPGPALCLSTDCHAFSIYAIIGMQVSASPRMFREHSQGGPPRLAGVGWEPGSERHHCRLSGVFLKLWHPLPPLVITI